MWACPGRLSDDVEAPALTVSEDGRAGHRWDFLSWESTGYMDSGGDAESESVFVNRPA